MLFNFGCKLKPFCSSDWPSLSYRARTVLSLTSWPSLTRHLISFAENDEEIVTLFSPLSAILFFFRFRASHSEKCHGGGGVGNYTSGEWVRQCLPLVSFIIIFYYFFNIFALKYRTFLGMTYDISILSIVTFLGFTYILSRLSSSLVSWFYINPMTQNHSLSSEKQLFTTIPNSAFTPEVSSEAWSWLSQVVSALQHTLLPGPRLLNFYILLKQVWPA